MNRQRFCVAATAALLTTSNLAAAAQDATSPPAPPAAPEPVVAPAELAEVRAETMARYEEYLRAAEKEQRAALKAVEAARADLETRVREERAKAGQASTAAQAQRAQGREELQAVQRELQRAHENLRRASRDVARVHREINRPSAPRVTRRFSYRTENGEDRAVIGVILGDNAGDGVKVLGVSPDGPAERAGLKPGDVIVSVMDEPLADGRQSPNTVLHESLEDIQPGDEIRIAVDRDGVREAYTVVAAKREPFTWHLNSRLASAPVAGSGSNVLVETIVAPDIDRERLDEEMKRLREELDRIRVLDDDGHVVAFGDGAYEFEFEEFSDFGDTVLAGTNIWFGMPLTRGLKLTELDPGLGRYFDTEAGVLVLQARDDNDLQLLPGDVILKVGDTVVTTPADVMRALRGYEAGADVAIDIKRDRQDRTLSVVLPETRTGLMLAPGNGFTVSLAPDIHADHDEPGATAD